MITVAVHMQMRCACNTGRNITRGIKQGLSEHTSKLSGNLVNNYQNVTMPHLMRCYEQLAGFDGGRTVGLGESSFSYPEIAACVG